MKSPLFKRLFNAASVRLEPRAARHAMFAGAAVLGGALPVWAATNVPAGSNLTTPVNAATTANHEFDLLGDVTMGGIIYLSDSARQNIIINANGHTITRTGDVRFVISQANSSLTIDNARITGTASSDTGGAIRINANNATLNLAGTVFDGNTATTGWGIISVNATGAKIDGDVSFTNNVTATSEVSAVHALIGSSTTFTGQTSFSNNQTGYYGAAVAVRENATVTFKENATFDGNYATAYFGGAIDVYGGNSKIVFEKDATFTNNYVKNTTVTPHGYGVRGGAIHVGYLAGSTSPQLELQGATTFADNYVWGTGATVGVGGALSLAVAGGDPLGQGQIGTGFVYGANIAQGIFQNNYAYSENSGGYGGAIFAKSYNGTLSLGSGSSFTGNAAKTLGGAIYFDQGTLNLTGNVAFSGNRQGATFTTGTGRPVLSVGSGSANAIYFAVSSNTATLNLSNATGELIDFGDPIQSDSGKTVTVNKTGAGTVRFTEHNSDILAQTTVSGGTFALGAGAGYGRLGTSATSNFNLAAGATLSGGAGATLRATDVNLNGRVAVAPGQFNVNATTVALSSSSVLEIVINSATEYSKLALGGGALTLAGGSGLSVSLDYLPEVGTIYSIVTGATTVSNASADMAYERTFFVGDVELKVVALTGGLALEVMAIPEPSTYGLIAGAGLLALVGLRRRSRKSGR